MRDLYKILGVPKTASPDEIKKAYRRGAANYHPDKTPEGIKTGKDEGGKFNEVSEAYRVLSNPYKRLKYDQFGIQGVEGQPSMRSNTEGSRQNSQQPKDMMEEAIKENERLMEKARMEREKTMSEIRAEREKIQKEIREDAVKIQKEVHEENEKISREVRSEINNLRETEFNRTPGSRPISRWKPGTIGSGETNPRASADEDDFTPSGENRG